MDDLPDDTPRPRRWQHWCRECWGVTWGGSPCAPREPDPIEEEEESDTETVTTD